MHDTQEPDEIITDRPSDISERAEPRRERRSHHGGLIVPAHREDNSIGAKLKLGLWPDWLVIVVFIAFCLLLVFLAVIVMQTTWWTGYRY